MQRKPEMPQVERPEPETLTSDPGRVRRWTNGGAVVAVLLLIWFFAAGEVPGEGQHIGIWSILPAVTTLVLVFITREVVSSLFAGIAVGGIVSGQLNLVSDFLIPSIGSEQYALILLVYLWALGGLIGLWTRTGGAVTFAEWAAAKIVRGPRSARFFAWLMGVVFHQGGRAGGNHGAPGDRPAAHIA
jgi:hypothetical protein